MLIRDDNEIRNDEVRDDDNVKDYFASWGGVAAWEKLFLRDI